jgi:hypothetical protein
MVGEGEHSEYYDWNHINTDPSEDRGFLYYKNIGSDQNPVLDFPIWIRSGPDNQVISYSRPNLGDVVDWNNDGRIDFIGCEFEKNARVYLNTSSNEVPQFTSSKNGTIIVQPWTIQMMSGVDAIDINGDGDIDIVTGQGHGESGLTFFERDYLDSFLNNTHPVIQAGEIQMND